MTVKTDLTATPQSDDGLDILVRSRRPDIHRRCVRRPQLRQIVPLGDTTIYELEQRGEFPRRFNLTPRCVVWDLAEVEAWVENRRRLFEAGLAQPASPPDVRQRKARPVR
jgi:prophage regulatory protein